MKLLEMYNLGERAKGLVNFLNIDFATGKVKSLHRSQNLVLFSGADVLANLIAGRPGWNISTLYLEFKNLASPGDPVSAPTYDRTGGIEYYTGLAASPDTDFVRVPLTTLPMFGNSDNTKYNNNLVTFFAMSEGTVGFHGKPFSAAANSAVYGAALVAAPNFADQSQDVVYARVYDGIDKTLKEIGHEVGVTWTAQFN